MLNNEKIKQAMENGDIKITVYFEIKDGKLVQLESEKDLLSVSLKDNLYSDRLKLTMGPIIKILNKKHVSSKHRFKCSLNYYDLRTSNNKYIINPGESIIVLTNERVKLNGKYACLIVPRISLSDVGIVVTTAYVDPYYDGLLRLHLTNFSEKSYELSSLEAIAQCFFFELPCSVSNTYREHFSTKSVFFGQTWHEIFQSDRNPFPTKKEANNINTFIDLKYQLSLIWSFVKKHSLILLIFLNISTIICGFTIFKQKFIDYNLVVEQLEATLKPKACEIVIDTGKRYGEKEIFVDYAKSDIVSVLCNNDEIHYKILSGDKQNEAKIIFSVDLDYPSHNKNEISFMYVIIRRLE